MESPMGQSAYAPSQTPRHNKTNKITIATISILLLTSSLIIGFTENVTPQRPIEVGCLDFPPYYIVKSENEVEGIYIDFLKALLDRIGISYTVAGYPPPRLYANLAAGRTNLWMGTVGVAAYADKVIVSPEKVTDITLGAYSIGDTATINSIAEMRDKKIITIQGYNYGGLIQSLEDPANGIILDPSPNHESGLKKLLAKRGDYLLDYKEPAEQAMSKMKISPSHVRFGQISTIEVYFNINKKTPDAAGLMTKMMDALRAMKEEGTTPF